MHKRQIMTSHHDNDDDDVTYLGEASDSAIRPWSLTLHQLASSDVKLRHLAAACSRMLSPVRPPRLQPLKLSSCTNHWSSVI